MSQTSLKKPIASSPEFDLFEFAPISLWESDYSELKKYLQLDWAKNVENMEQFLLEHPENFECCMQKIRVVNLNQATLRLFKASTKQQLILGLEQSYTEEGVVGFAKAIADIYRGETEGCCRSRIRDLQGFVREIEVHWSVMPQYVHCFSRVIAAITLVDEKETQSIIGSKHNTTRVPERFQNFVLQRALDIIESIPDLVAHGDFATNRITYMNAAGRRLLDIGLDENISHRKIAHFHKPEFFDRLKNEILPLLQAHKVWTGQTEFITTSGEVIPVIQIIVPHFDRCGELSGISTIVKDMRDIKETEAKILMQQQELANIYRLSSMNEVASSIAHEINQPLTALSNYASGCLRRSKTQEVSKEIVIGIEGVVAQAKRAGEIVHHIKNYLKRGELQQQTIDVNRLLKEAVELSIISPKADIVLNYQLAKSLPTILGDKLYLQQMLVNLISNAVQALQQTQQQTRVLGMQTECSEDDSVKITISDNGIGMSDAIKEKIFTPLFTRTAGGTGMGLALVRYIIEQHGGSVAVFSTPKLGSQFVITLPILVKA